MTGEGAFRVTGIRKKNYLGLSIGTQLSAERNYQEGLFETHTINDVLPAQLTYASVMDI
jgi:hypothetical protein